MLRRRGRRCGRRRDGRGFPREPLSNARDSGGQIQDRTGQGKVRVDVGAGDDSLSFDPAGIRVDVGTTVVWDWTGQGGGHDVASTTESDFEFQRQRTEQAGHTFEETFDEEGVALYVCQPHPGSRMKGGIDVVWNHPFSSSDSRRAPHDLGICRPGSLFNVAFETYIYLIDP